MEQILLDTNFVSVLFDSRRPNFDAVKARAQAFTENDLIYLSAIVLAESVSYTHLTLPTIYSV